MAWKRGYDGRKDGGVPADEAPPAGSDPRQVATVRLTPKGGRFSKPGQSEKDDKDGK